MSLALYRRYRPDTFTEVIGQEHVTAPLGQALKSGRIHHAFLFSGPRGCGKTTSARILARALNCEQGPTPTPCGECQSCQDLANGGPGSLDVIEIDAASHGGVDDARDLRERAFYAPVQSRYKIYIIDEAHMVSREGFNALLKLVEEPPEFLKFVFATTEPDKVLATIRSRTHHYAFRLVAPRVLADHLKRICEAEGVTIEDAVLPMVVRAGAGSVRDALSVLDQLVAGAEGSTITVAYASGLLGYTDTALLDAVVDAFGTRRGSEVFETLDRALDSGLDPRRFVADLLERFRDLLILAVSGADAIEMQALVPAPPDERERMVEQAKLFGPAELTRNAELLAAGLVEMRGATAPRLTLELIAARMLLPTADDTERQLQVRLEQVERQLRQGVSAAPASAAPVPPAPSAPVGTTASPAVDPPVATPAPVEVAPAAAPRTAEPAAVAPASPVVDPPVSAPPAVSGGAVTTIDDVRRMWPQVVEAVKGRKRSAWIQLNRPGAGVVSVTGDRLALGLPDAGTVKGFNSGGYGDVVKLAVMDVMGVDLQIDVIAQSAPAAPAAAAPASPTGSPAPAPERPSKPSGAERVAAAKAAPATETPNDDDIEHGALAQDSDDDALSGEALLAQALDARQIGEIQH
jgi:DNA polymerase-3 subunit gamma/tau